MKRKILKRIIPILLSLMLVFSASAVFAVSANAASVKSVSTQAALETAVGNGESIKLTKSLTLDKTIIIPSDVEVTLDLNGKTLDRSLAACVDQGSTIIVQPNATLTVTDSTGSNTGIITGGAAWKGGGICNYGTLTIEGGTITGNKALHETQGGGGGIYSGSLKGSVATLTIKGGIISNNRSRIGGGIYNGPGSALIILEGERLMKKGAKKVTVTDNVVITSNKVTSHGSGLFGSGTINIQDSPEIYDNNTDDEVFLPVGKKINFTGELKTSRKIKIKADGTNPVLTSNYGKFNSKGADAFFKSATNDAVLMLNDSKEIILKTDTDTVVQLFDNSGLKKTENYPSVETAWDKAVSYGDTWQRVEVTLGGDWEHDRQLKTANDDKTSNIVLDLNGHYIKRTRNFSQKSDGEVFYVPKKCTFTVKDSNPERKGYDGLKGGVICGGASTNGGGGIHVSEKATFNMLGGTLYECITNSDGGGIKAYGKDIVINMKNCNVRSCQTFDATTETNGGGIYLYSNTVLTLENVTFEDCYSEDSGGAIYARMDSGSKITAKNCFFLSNKATDDGGAICIDDNKDPASFRADGCKFINNIALRWGGAIYLDCDNGEGEDEKPTHSPVLFNDCIFRMNRADVASAIYTSHSKNLILNDCTVTENKADDFAGVYISLSGSVGGLTVIKDNTAPNRGADLYLLGGNVQSTGLAPGSYVSVNSQNTSYLSKNMSEYQMQYFHSSSDTLEFEATQSVKTPFITASVFGKGSYIVIAGVSAAAVISVAAALIIKKKKGGIKDDDDEEDDE